jgi:HlyD family secretion protein
VAAEFQGHVTKVRVRAGDDVEAGQVLVTVSNTGFQAAVDQAKAALEAAQADLAEVRSGPRPEAVAAQRARVAVAQAEWNKAQAAYQAALAAWRDPQALQQRILEAQAQAALAAGNVELAQAQYAQAQHEADHTEWNTTERRILDLQAEAKMGELEAARADQAAAEAVLQHLREMEATPLSYLAELHRAMGQSDVADAAVRVAQEELRDLEAGATEEEVALAQAKVDLARAQLHLAELQSERLTLRSSAGGTVVARTVNVGETALPGVTLLIIADLSEVYLTVYVPQAQLGRVSVGQAVDVTVDSFPQRRFVGSVAHIADQPQYTPRNVVTKEERVTTVYGVKVRLANPQGLLKQGMAADAVFT